MSKYRPDPPALTEDERAEILAEHALLLPSVGAMTAKQRATVLTDRVQALEHELRRTARERLSAIAELIETGECTEAGPLGRMLGLNSPGAIWPLFRAAEAHLAHRHAETAAEAEVEDIAAAGALPAGGSRRAETHA